MSGTEEILAIEGLSYGHSETVKVTFWVILLLL